MLALNARQRKVLAQVHVNMPWRYLERYLDLVLEFGLNLELGFEAGVLDACPYADYHRAAERLRRRGCRLTMHGPFWDLCPGSSDPLVRQVSRLRLGQFFDLVSLFEPLAVVCHTGFDPRHHGAGMGEWVERALTVWEPLVARAERQRVALLLENVWEADPELHRRLLERIDSPWCGFCLDVGHQHTFSRAPLQEWLQALGHRLGEVHLHDNDGAGDAHLPVASGTINFPLLFDFLVERRLRPVLTLEPHQEEHLVQSLEGLSRIVAPSFWSRAAPAGDGGPGAGDDYKLTACRSSTMEV